MGISIPQGEIIRTIFSLRCARLRTNSERGSVAVEYVGLAVVIAMLTAAVGSAVDSAMGERIAHALVERLVSAVTSQ
jgi:hypothetical protein